jgi:hypothetical protein
MIDSSAISLLAFGLSQYAFRWKSVRGSQRFKGSDDILSRGLEQNLFERQYVSLHKLQKILCQVLEAVREVLLT